MTIRWVWHKPEHNFPGPDACSEKQLKTLLHGVTGGFSAESISF